MSEPPSLPPDERPPTNKGRRLPAVALTRAEVHALIGAASRHAPTGLRNRALIVVIYRTGVRLHEALALLPQDVRSDGRLRLRGGSAKRDIRVLDPFALAVVDDWLECRRRLGPPLGAPLFCTLRGASLKDSYVRELLPRLAARAGVHTRVHIEGLRLTYRIERDNEPVS